MKAALTQILPSIFTWHEALDTGSNRRIDQCLLNLPLGVREWLYEGEESMDIPKSLYQKILVVVVHYTPSDTR